jgi:hypothetical protein
LYTPPVTPWERVLPEVVSQLQGRFILKTHCTANTSIYLVLPSMQ